MVSNGRPCSFTQEQGDAICILLAEGRSLNEICRMENMPDKSTVIRWLGKYPDFRHQYAKAKEVGIEVWAEDILDIADDGSNDWMERKNAEGECIGWSFNGEAAKRSQIRIDARKWLLSKLAPKRFGDKVQQEHTGPNGGPVQFAKVERVIVRPQD